MTIAIFGADSKIGLTFVEKLIEKKDIGDKLILFGSNMKELRKHNNSQDVLVSQIFYGNHKEDYVITRHIALNNKIDKIFVFNATDFSSISSIRSANQRDFAEYMTIMNMNAIFITKEFIDILIEENTCVPDTFVISNYYMHNAAGQLIQSYEYLFDVTSKLIRIPEIWGFDGKGFSVVDSFVFEFMEHNKSKTNLKFAYINESGYFIDRWSLSNFLFELVKCDYSIIPIKLNLIRDNDSMTSSIMINYAIKQFRNMGYNMTNVSLEQFESSLLVGSEVSTDSLTLNKIAGHEWKISILDALKKMIEIKEKTLQHVIHS